MFLSIVNDPNDMQIYLPVTTEKSMLLIIYQRVWIRSSHASQKTDQSEVIVFGPSETRTQNILNLQFLNLIIH